MTERDVRGAGRDSGSTPDIEGIVVSDRVGRAAEPRLLFLRRFFRVWTYLTGTLVTMLIGAEVCSRVVLFQLPDRIFKNIASVSQWEKRPGLKIQFSSQSGFGLYPTPGYSNGIEKINSWGFRGEEVSVPKPANTFRIACLGGSTTWDWGVQDACKTYPAQLQAALRKRGVPAEVINAGAPGWSSREQILNYVTRVSYLDPDMIIFFEPCNDLIYRASWPPETLRSDYTHPEALLPRCAKPRWYMSMTLLRVPLILFKYEMPTNLEIATSQSDFFNQGYDNLRQAASNSKEDEEIPRAGPSTIPAGMTLKDVFAVMPTDYFANNVSSIITCAKQRHTMVLLVSGLWDWKAVDALGADYYKGIRYGVAQMNEALARVAREQNVFFYDLAGEWPENADTPYWVEQVHNNEAGALLKAELIAKYMLKEDLIPGVH